MVLNKPPLLPTAGRSLDDPDCLQFWLMMRHRRMVWAVHQLDADTTGVNVFVWKKTLVPVYQERMRFPNAQKSYLAIVHGDPAFDELRIAEPLGYIKTEDFSGQGVVQSGKKSATQVTVLGRNGRHALVRARLETGRTHQVRVHLAHVGHPLVGEEWYRRPACTEHPRQALHAERVEFRDGIEPGLFEAPLTSDLLELVDRLGLAQCL
ncbi:MAG: 23S rRNA-/tRNA-specific pseudouridylate synthase [Bradymonadia bacterium]|jgi:23S rRNA-/tRNA-specific pseudouridylate synthase